MTRRAKSAADAARAGPPPTLSLSLQLVDGRHRPVLGTVSGAWWLNEALHWQDGAAIVLVLAAIASVMWPARAQRE